jgi:hypothetical protein
LAQVYARPGAPGQIETLALSEYPLMLGSGQLGEIQLMLTHSFRLVQDAPHDWHVSTAGYEYRINDADGRELAAWHWHPRHSLGQISRTCTWLLPAWAIRTCQPDGSASSQCSGY